MKPLKDHLPKIYFLLVLNGIALLYAFQTYIAFAYRQPISWGDAFRYAFPEWYIFGALSLPILWLGRRFPVNRTQNVFLHFGFAVIFSVVHIVLLAAIFSFQRSDGKNFSDFYSNIFRNMMINRLHFNIIIYAVILIVQRAMFFYRQYRESEIRTAQLENRLTQAQLQALKMQLNPHFLFNTLHAITTLIHKDPQLADKMIARLGELLRLTLEQDGVHEISLKQELDFLERYLDIEKMRLGERLLVNQSISDEALGAAVPNLILQPLVENAIRHGIAPHQRPGTIDLSAICKNGTLEINITDNGNGIQGSLREGVGLSNTRERLIQLYNGSHKFELKKALAGGLSVLIQIPLKTII